MVYHQGNFYSTRNHPGFVMPQTATAVTNFYGSDGSSRHYLLPFEQYFELNLRENPCIELEGYSMDQCIQDKIHQETMEKIGCTTPFGPNKTQICKDPKKSKNALEIYNRIIGDANDLCLSPCEFIKPHMTLAFDHPNLNETYHYVKIINGNRVKVMKSEYSYPFISFVAEAGGYVGLFLGVSIQELGSLVMYVSKMFK